MKSKYNEIILQGRYGLKHKLKLVSTEDDNLVYKLIIDLEGGEHYRCISDKDDSNKIVAIDPPGGPMFCLGSSLYIDDKYKLKDIYFNPHFDEITKKDISDIMLVYSK